MAEQRRIEEIAAFYARYATMLERGVGRQVRDLGVAQEACSQAWEQLLERPDVILDQRGYGWLRTVAVHAGRRHGKEAAKVDSLDFELPSGETVGEAAVGRDAPASVRAQAAERLALVERLTPDQRRALLTQAAGCSYAEIARITQWSFTKVNHELAEGRAQLRVLEQAAVMPRDRREQLEAARAALAALVVQRGEVPSAGREQHERRVCNVSGAIRALSVEVVEAQVRDPPAWAQATFGQRPNVPRLAGVYDEAVRGVARFRVAQGVDDREPRLGAIPLEREARVAYRQAERALGDAERALGQSLSQDQQAPGGSRRGSRSRGRGGVSVDRDQDQLGR
ncbi:MAG: RNA polymerase sigma factor [Solirubrobacteraceae bacterium]